MSNLDDFHNSFSSTIIKIEQEHVKYVNDTINIDGTRLDKSHNNSEKNILLPLYALQEINVIAYTLYSLEKKGITSSNYFSKVKKYKNLSNKFFEEFGVIVEMKDEYRGELAPFSNPADLYKRIDDILTFHKLRNENKKNFYVEFLNRERLPKQSITTELERKKYEESCLEKIILPDFENLYINLPSDQQSAILNADYNYKYDEKYYQVMDTWKLKEIPEYVMKFLLAFDIDEYNRMKHDKINHKKYIKQTISRHNFLSYPACLCTETEFLQKIIHFDMCTSEAFPF